MSTQSEVDAGRIYSVGYERWTLPNLVEMLRQNRVTTVVDVRLTPASRRPGFSKKALVAALTRAGIEYVHEPELGNPRENREAFRSGDVRAGRERMLERLGNGSEGALRRLADLAHASRVAVLCVEREAARCHRSVVVEAAKGLRPDLEVIPVL